MNLRLAMKNEDLVENCGSKTAREGTIGLWNRGYFLLENLGQSKHNF